jgi:hypothetical protein
MGDTQRQIFALLSFIVGGAIVALLVGHASQTSQLLTGGLGGFNTLLNTIENPQGGSASLGTTGSTLSGIGTGLQGTASLVTGLGNLGSAIGNLGGGSYTYATGTSVPGGTDYGGGSDIAGS